MDADHVVVATGYAREPFVPPWPGRDRFRAPLLHAADYRNAGPFRERHVLVVGCGSSGMEIAYDLATDGVRPRKRGRSRDSRAPEPPPPLSTGR